MQIILTEAEIRAAVDSFARSKIALQPGQTIEMDFSVTRNPTAVQATLDVVSEEVETTVTATPAVASPAKVVETPVAATTASTTAAKEKPKPEPEKKPSKLEQASASAEKTPDEAPEPATEQVDEAPEQEADSEGATMVAGANSIFSKAKAV